jgi:hypothetical protein
MYSIIPVIGRGSDTLTLWQRILIDKSNCTGVPLTTEPGIEGIATKFEQEYIRCVRNEDECVCRMCVCIAPNCCDTEQRSANQWKIIKEMSVSVASGTPYILNLPLHVCDINSNYCICLCPITPWERPKKAETCSRIINMFVFYFNCNAVFGVQMVTCH